MLVMALTIHLVILKLFCGSYRAEEMSRYVYSGVVENQESHCEEDTQIWSVKRRRGTLCSWANTDIIRVNSWGLETCSPALRTLDGPRAVTAQ